MAHIPSRVRQLIKNALYEDIGSGDITTDSILSPSRKGQAHIIAKDKAVIAGMPFAREVFGQVDRKLIFRTLVEDSSKVKKGDVVCKIEGSVASILKAERVALNILQRLSGIATLTNFFVERLKGLDTRIVDTRKTTPGLRYMEKYAVRAGGGHNHRFGLYDGILIKDNHIEAVGSIGRAVAKVRKASRSLKIEVETGNLKEVEEAIGAGVGIIMLDNMSLAMMKRAVKLIRKKDKGIIVEASGNVTLKTVRDIALTGVDMISVGALTHSAPSADLSLKMVR